MNACKHFIFFKDKLTNRILYCINLAGMISVVLPSLHSERWGNEEALFQGTKEKPDVWRRKTTTGLREW